MDGAGREFMLSLGYPDIGLIDLLHRWRPAAMRARNRTSRDVLQFSG